MSRELRRVPLDFAHPLREVWPGFIPQGGGPCPARNVDCFNGSTAAGAWLQAICQQFQMIAEESAKTPAAIAYFKNNGRTYPHPFLELIPHVPRQDTGGGPTRLPPLAPLTREFVELYVAVSGDKTIGDTFRGYNGDLAAALIKVAGFDPNWGTCKVCGGHADDPALRAEAEAWKPSPPPDGPGFQVWESVTEGSPISPVFETEAQLEDWLAGEGYSRESAKAFIKAGWVCSVLAITSPDGSVKVFDDIEGAGR